MYFAECFGSPFWWIFPLIMIFFCFFMMRGSMGRMWASGDKRHIEPDPSALEILERRYAAGEIDKEELDEMKRVLAIPDEALPKEGMR